MVADHLPSGRPQGHRRLSERAGDGPERLLSRDHDHRQDQQASVSAAGPERLGPSARALNPNARTNTARPSIP